MTTRFDLGQLEWELFGWTPHLWRLYESMEIGAKTGAEIGPIRAKVPGSVQSALRLAGILPDWNVGLNARQCEWAENRHWFFEVHLPDSWFKSDGTYDYRLECLGLDYSGSIYVNRNKVGDFRGTHKPHVFLLTEHLQHSGNTLRVFFDLPPRWLGQFGYTSQMTDLKARFNYTWDWTPRIVQIGIWDGITLVRSDGREITNLRCQANVEDPERSRRVEDHWGTTCTGSLKLSASCPKPDGCRVRVSLTQNNDIIREQTISAEQFESEGIDWNDLPVALWWPNLQGEQQLYTLSVHLLDTEDRILDKTVRRIGFRNVVWKPCEGATANADPWICNVNGRPIFLQGVNFPPVLPNFADASQERYEKLLRLYRDLGVNLVRVNGVGFLEKECFYDLCDELGIMVWQDMPLSSSGVENLPPDDSVSIDNLSDIFRSYIARRQHHPSLMIWCGGNELQRKDSEGRSVPVGLEYPLLHRFSEIASENDPTRRFIPTTATGPRFFAEAQEFGKGVHWNVHGPWKLWSDMSAWEEYWRHDDALFRAETGAPGASPADIIRQYAGDLDPMPIDSSNDLWRRPIDWWVESDVFLKEFGRAPESLDEYVAWSQQRQAEALSIAVTACKSRFPRCGGILLWCGHDCFPCASNTSIIDFHGNPKPAAEALREIWREPKTRDFEREANR